MKKNRKVKIIIGVVVVLLVALAIYAFPRVKKMLMENDYKSYLTETTKKETTEFKALKDKEPAVSGMVLAAENDNFKLYTNKKTTEIALYDKRSKQVYYSNPLDKATATGQMLNAQFTITYYDSERKSGTMDNYKESIELEQFELEGIEKGIRYTYTLGDTEAENGIVPLVISKERLESFLANVSEKDARTIRKNYKESETKQGHYELLEASISPINIKKMTKILEAAGYSKEEYDKDMEGIAVEESIGFTIPLDYQLTEDGLTVSIETSEIVERGGAKLYCITLLKHFGAANLVDKGYMFVPNGSGALIHFNNGKGNYGYTQNIYGVDPTVAGYTVVENTTTARLPVFGMKYEDHALFAIIEKGEALTRLDAFTSSNTTSYNNVYPTFYVRGYELLSMFGATGSQADLPLVEDNLYKTDWQIQYVPLNGDDANYSGMANYYREYLIEKGVLGEKLQNTQVPFFLDVLGGVNVPQNILGVIVDDVVPMTTYKEAADIVNRLNQLGVGNIKMNYLGWFNGGYYHDVPDQIKHLSELGSKKEFAALATQLAADGGMLYGNVAFNEVCYTSKNYVLSQEAANYYNGKVVLLGSVNPYTLKRGTNATYKETMYTVLSPRYLNYYVEKFTEEFKGYNVSGVGLRDLGSVLSADKNRMDLIHRQDALQLTLAALETISKENSLLVQGGNAYSLGYTTDIVDAPIDGSKFMLLDEIVPFYGMVIHGYINYAGDELNLTQTTNRDLLLLDLIENGASLRYVLSYEKSDSIKYSGLNSMYSVQYELYTEEIEEFYKELSNALGEVVNVPIVGHEILENDVRKVTYENGVVIYINRGSKDVSVDGITVPAQWYIKKAGV